MSAIRTFIAVNLTSKIRARAGHCIERLRSAQADYNWVAPENLHITLNFLGDVLDTEIPGLCERIKSVAEFHSHFQLNVIGMGGFPHRTRPRVVWLGIKDQPLPGGNAMAAPRLSESTADGSAAADRADAPSEMIALSPLLLLHTDLADMLCQLGFPKERFGFNPHLTLGRLRRGGRWNQALTDVIQNHEQFDAGNCKVSEVVVYSSHLEKTGPTYTAMSRIELS